MNHDYCRLLMGASVALMISAASAQSTGDTSLNNAAGINAPSADAATQSQASPAPNDRIPARSAERGTSADQTVDPSANTNVTAPRSNDRLPAQSAERGAATGQEASPPVAGSSQMHQRIKSRASSHASSSADNSFRRELRQCAMAQNDQARESCLDDAIAHQNH